MEGGGGGGGRRREGREGELGGVVTITRPQLGYYTLYVRPSATKYIFDILYLDESINIMSLIVLYTYTVIYIDISYLDE